MKKVIKIPRQFQHINTGKVNPGFKVIEIVFKIFLENCRRLI